MLFSTMHAADLNRKTKLKELLQTRYRETGRAQFCKDVGLSASRVSQLLDPDEAFGERVARKICERLRLPLNWFELPQGVHRALTAVQRNDDRFAVIFDLPADLQESVFKIVMAMRGANPAGAIKTKVNEARDEIAKYYRRAVLAELEIERLRRRVTYLDALQSHGSANDPAFQSA